MPEELLHDTQVRTTVEQVGGETVTQRVWVDRIGRPVVENSPHVAGAERPPTTVEEQVRIGARRTGGGAR